MNLKKLDNVFPPSCNGGLCKLKILFLVFRATFIKAFIYEIMYYPSFYSCSLRTLSEWAEENSFLVFFKVRHVSPSLNASIF